jgi:hypothetical protein
VLRCHRDVTLSKYVIISKLHFPSFGSKISCLYIYTLPVIVTSPSLNHGRNVVFSNSVLPDEGREAENVYNGVATNCRHITVIYFLMGDFHRSLYIYIYI